MSQVRFSCQVTNKDIVAVLRTGTLPAENLVVVSPSFEGDRWEVRPQLRQATDNVRIRQLDVITLRQLSLTVQPSGVISLFINVHKPCRYDSWSYSRYAEPVQDPRTAMFEIEVETMTSGEAKQLTEPLLDFSRSNTQSHFA